MSLLCNDYLLTPLRYELELTSCRHDTAVIRGDTAVVRDDTAVIRHHTLPQIQRSNARILSQIERLRLRIDLFDLQTHENHDNDGTRSTGFILGRYLDDISRYAQSTVGTTVGDEASSTVVGSAREQDSHAAASGDASRSTGIGTFPQSQRETADGIQTQLQPERAAYGTEQLAAGPFPDRTVLNEAHRARELLTPDELINLDTSLWRNDFDTTRSHETYVALEKCLRAGADPNPTMAAPYKNFNGHQGLVWRIVHAGNYDCLRLALSYGAHPDSAALDTVSTTYATPLELAVWQLNTRVANLLVLAGAKHNGTPSLMQIAMISYPGVNTAVGPVTANFALPIPEQPKLTIEESAARCENFERARLKTVEMIIAQSLGSQDSWNQGLKIAIEAIDGEKDFYWRGTTVLSFMLKHFDLHDNILRRFIPVLCEISRLHPEGNIWRIVQTIISRARELGKFDAVTKNLSTASFCIPQDGYNQSDFQRYIITTSQLRLFKFLFKENIRFDLDVPTDQKLHAFLVAALSHRSEADKRERRSLLISILRKFAEGGTRYDRKKQRTWPGVAYSCSFDHHLYYSEGRPKIDADLRDQILAMGYSPPSREREFFARIFPFLLPKHYKQ
jgi:hypothetical protein